MLLDGEQVVGGVHLEARKVKGRKETKSERLLLLFEYVNTVVSPVASKPVGCLIGFLQQRSVTLRGLDGDSELESSL